MKRSRSDLILAVSCTLWVLALQACGEPTEPPKPIARAPATLLTDAMLAASDQGFAQAEIPAWPDGFSTHAQMQVESFQLEAFLFPVSNNVADNETSGIGLIARISRLALRPQSDAPSEQSAWQFDDLVRSSVFTDTTLVNQTGNASTNSDSASLNAIGSLPETIRDMWVERLALGLSGVSDDSLWIRNDKLQIAISTPSENNEEPQCQREYAWTSTLSYSQSVELQIPFDRCPRARLVGPLVSWQQFSDTVSAMLITKHLPGDVKSTPMQGFGWLQHGWGNALTGQGAVIIDTLRIRLENQQILNISRSKRRTGRGPKTVQATLQRNALPAAPVEIEWLDSQEQRVSDSGAVYPDVISLQNPELGISLQVQLMNSLSETSNVSDNYLHVPVQISGSHKGQGFLVFNSQMPDP